MRELYLSTSAVQQAVIAQAKAINMIADQGSCVIIGRAADYVLRNRENVVRIFIHAPKDYRVKKVMEMYGDTEQEGKRALSVLTAPEEPTTRAFPVMYGAIPTNTN